MIFNQKLTKLRMISNKKRRELRKAESDAAEVVAAARREYETKWMEYANACRDAGYCAGCRNKSVKCQCVVLGATTQRVEQTQGD